MFPRPRATVALALLTILALGAWFRLCNLGTNPPGVFRDEAEKALNAWSLRQRGEAFEFAPGEGGSPVVRWRRWPLFIHVYGVETSSIYQSALSLLAHGAAPPSPFVMRLPAAFAGILAVLCVFLMASRLYGTLAGLAAAFWLAISPWDVIFSRWALQGSFIPLFIATGMGGAALALRGRRAGVVLFGLFLGLAFYTYSGARPFVLAMAFAAISLHWRDLKKGGPVPLSLAALFFAIPLAITLHEMFAPGGMSRFERIGIFQSGQGPLTSALLFLPNYIRHFSPGFLLLHGDSLPRHGVQSFGQIGHIEFLFALLGLWRLWRTRPPEFGLWIAWLLLFPVGAALTDPAENPHALRSIVALPLPQILAGIGVAWLVRTVGVKTKLNGGRSAAGVAVLALAGFAIAADAGLFAWDLFHLYRRYSARYWEAGFGETLQAARVKAGSDHPVYISGTIALAPYLTMYYDNLHPDRLAGDGWAALKVELLPPPPDFDLRTIWPMLPSGAILLSPSQDRAPVPPIFAMTPRALEESGDPFPTYCLYRKP